MKPQTWLIVLGYLLAAFLLLLQNPLTPWPGLVLLGYLVGGIPFGLIAGRLRGVDVTAYGSGKIGTTNVLRTMGYRTAAAVFVADFLKGMLPVLLARLYEPYFLAGELSGLAMALTGLAALTGHNFSPYIGFKGGRGIATGVGGLAAMFFWAAAFAIAVWAVAVLLTRYVSLGSILGAASALVTIPALAFFGQTPWLYSLYVVLGVPLIVWQHRDNIQRLRNGTERKLGQKAERRA